MTVQRTIGIGCLVLLGMASGCLAGWFDWGGRQIVVVRGTTSVPDPGERPYAAKLARQTSDWLTELGLDHRLLDDDAITSWSLRGTHAVILPYNPKLSARELKAFQSVIRSGGILVVCYGMDTNLAALMEVKLDTYRKVPEHQGWRAFRFDPTAVPGLPPLVAQTSNQLVPAYPASGGAQIIAFWCDKRGNPTLDPAWVKSPAGFWMSHVLLPGDDENTKRMLLAMLARVIPDVWDTATAHLLSSRRPFGEYETLKAAQQDLGWDAPPALRGPAGYEAARSARNTLTRRYAQRKIAAPEPTLRGVWVDEDPGAWPRIQSTLRQQGINTVFFHVGTPLDPGDMPPVGQATPTAPLALHAWLTCFNLETLTGEQQAQLRREHRLQVSDTGETLPWLCPSHPANRKLLADTVARLAKVPGVSGIHLDYIRYNNIHACYCPGCRGRFELTIGHTLEPWPHEAIKGDGASAYRQWRAGQVTACVSAARDAIRSVNPAVKLSAAVYGATPSCISTVGQDWPLWLKTGILDFACPMNYTPDLNAYAALLTTQAALPEASRILPGVGVASSLSRLTADQTVAQINAIRRLGFPGFVIFELTSHVESDVLPYLGGNSWPSNGQH